MNALSLRVASRWMRVATKTLRVSGGDRQDALGHVWAMYEKTYRSIGLHIPDPQGLLRYPVWDLDLGRDGIPVSFTLYKKTSYGLKLGLLGSDGSGEGKSAALKILRTRFKQSGYFGEVSHKVASIVIAAGSPVICAVYAGAVLGKPITPTGDGLHYKRSLGDLGVVEKVLVGKPKGVPTTSFNNPACPAEGGRLAFEQGMSEMDMAEHVASLIL